MRNLQLLAEGGIRTQVHYQGLRLTAAFGLAVIAVVLAFLGLMWRYPSADVSTPLPGMNHWSGQLGWSFLLGALMVAAAWLVRGVVMARLQWAIVLSLVIHLFLLLTTQLMHLDFHGEWQYGKLQCTHTISSDKFELHWEFLFVLLTGA